jgi:uncharacterized protein YbbK (DUF523 family)/uncharacterized protein YbgA (DUF1722 family)
MTGSDGIAQLDRPGIGVSSCLLGESVRYDGGHKHNRYLTAILSSYVDFIPLCPELAIGLGVPRQSISLQGTADHTRAIMADPAGTDVTEALTDFGIRTSRSIQQHISGYILKSKSPSCGMEGVTIYNAEDIPGASGSGIYARALMNNLPLLPVAEENCLDDPDLRDNFLERVLLYHRWQQVKVDGPGAENLIAFHTENKFLIMAHDQESMRQLGRLVSDLEYDVATKSDRYIKLLMTALQKTVPRKNRTHVLQHIAGCLGEHLDKAERKNLTDKIAAYCSNEIPVIVPITLIRHHLREHPECILNNQRFPELQPAAPDTPGR